MKIALAQLNYHIGNFPQNVGKIIDSIHWAKERSADLVIYAELAICGYPPRDFLEFESFVQSCNDGLLQIAKECQGIAAIVGCPVSNRSGKGKALYNAACFLNNGQVEFIQRKTLLPTYDIFDEYRYFEPNSEHRTVQYKGKRIAITICEDLWNIGENKLYEREPMQELIKSNPDVVINISASPFSADHYKERSDMLIANAEKYQIPFLYVNHVGAQTELIFDGKSMVCLPGKGVVKTLCAFDEDRQIIDLEEDLEVEETNYTWENDVLSALTLGVKDYFRKSGFNKAVIGLSGGIDSALTVAIACKALGPINVNTLLMPSPYSSDHSIDDSIELCKRLGCSYKVIRIDRHIEDFDHSLNELFGDLPKDLTEENIQARVRSILLMAVSNKFGSILLNTSNKSEKAVGYGTLYGDLSGGLSVLGDVYKTQVYKLASYVNRKKDIIPNHILLKEPSAELRHDQRDTDSLPDYDELDPILYQYIEERKSADEIVTLGHDAQVVKRVLNLVNSSEYKRFQTAPILRVSKKAFGMGRRMPIVGKYLY
ncbi:MAG: NAD+ synthase [Vicingaceae bacterium]